MSEPGRPLDGARGRPARPPRPWPDRVSLDPSLVQRLNDEWRVTIPAGSSSLKQRLARPLRQLFGVLLRGQETFNSTIVQHLNHLHHVNVVTADRQESLRAMVDDVFVRTEVLFDRVEDLALDDLRRYSEAAAARDRRLNDAIVSLHGEHAEVRTALAVLQQQTNQITKQVARGVPAAVASAPAAAAAPAASSHALSHKYVGFEDAFRGSPEAIREGLRQYVPLFEDTSDVLDVGCGRGEFLSLLAQSGVRARGIDLNDSMVEICRENGLDAAQADALTYLRSQPDGSLGGLFAAQVVEHLDPAYLTHLLEVAFDKLRPGAPIVLETINPACWFAFFESYIRDITHERALHPDTLKFLLVASGFQQIEVRYSAPYPDHQKLQPIAAAAGLADAVETLNANVDKINGLLFTYLDYAAIGRRP